MKSYSIDLREHVYKIVSGLEPYDALERAHIQETLAWIQTGVEIFRVEKPATPSKHLVAYFSLWDEETEKMLLVDHKKASLWLPPGGHVEKGEDPQETVRRECWEELGTPAVFWQETPVFLTSTLTVGLPPQHTDVSLWYVLKGSSLMNYAFDEREFNAIRWFDFKDIPYERSDPHMRRFVEKCKVLQKPSTLSHEIGQKL